MLALRTKFLVASSGTRSPAINASPSRSLVTLRTTSRRQPRILCESRPRQKDNALVIGLVSALTETLRILGVGKDRYKNLINEERAQQKLAPGDIQGLMQRISNDFKQGYIVTGIIDDSIYDKNCWFADPTVSFSGLQLWKRNLQLLTPFLIKPFVRLREIRRTRGEGDSVETLRAEWELRTYLSLPWTPLISILGATEYVLNQERNQIMEHVESWNVSGVQALAQMFKPGNPQDSQELTP